MNDASVVVVNLGDGSVAKVIPNVPTGRGVMVAADVGRIFVTSSPDQLVLVDSTTLDEISRVKTGSSPDGVGVGISVAGGFWDAGGGARMGVLDMDAAKRAARFSGESKFVGVGRGTVAAASDWDGLMEIKRVRPARDDSYEGRARDTGIAAFMLETGPGQSELTRIPCRANWTANSRLIDRTAPFEAL
jgi:hypothetical protein